MHMTTNSCRTGGSRGQKRNWRRNSRSDSVKARWRDVVPYKNTFAWQPAGSCLDGTTAEKREGDVRRRSSLRRVPSRLNRKLERNRRGKNPQPQAVEQRGRAAHRGKVFNARKKLRGGRTILEAINTPGKPSQELTAYSFGTWCVLLLFYFFGFCLFVCFSADTSKNYNVLCIDNSEVEAVRWNLMPFI